MCYWAPWPNQYQFVHSAASWPQQLAHGWMVRGTRKGLRLRGPGLVVSAAAVRQAVSAVRPAVCCLHICFKYPRTSGCLSGYVPWNKLCCSGLTGDTKSSRCKGLCARVLGRGVGLTVGCWEAGWTSTFGGESCSTAISCGRLPGGSL